MTEIIDDVVKYHVENRIAWLSYNRPDKRNAMSPRVNRAMLKALEALAHGGDERAGREPATVARRVDQLDRIRWTVESDRMRARNGTGPARRHVDRTLEAGGLAARTSVEVAHGRGAPEAAPLLYEMADTPPLAVADMESVSTMFTRVVAYVDRYGR